MAISQKKGTPMAYNLDTFTDLDEVLFRNEYTKAFALEQDARVLRSIATKPGREKGVNRREKYLELHHNAAAAFDGATEVLEKQINRFGQEYDPPAESPALTRLRQEEEGS